MQCRIIDSTAPGTVWSVAPGTILPIAEFTKPLTATQRVTSNPVTRHRLGRGSIGVHTSGWG